jgi:hypothetical protein
MRRRRSLDAMSYTHHHDSTGKDRTGAGDHAGSTVLEIEARAVVKLSERLDESFCAP